MWKNKASLIRRKRFLVFARLFLVAQQRTQTGKNSNTNDGPFFRRRWKITGNLVRDIGSWTNETGGNQRFEKYSSVSFAATVLFEPSRTFVLFCFSLRKDTKSKEFSISSTAKFFNMENHRRRTLTCSANRACSFFERISFWKRAAKRHFFMPLNRCWIWHDVMQLSTSLMFVGKRSKPNRLLNFFDFLFFSKFSTAVENFFDRNCKKRRTRISNKR